eukprot:567466-Rhodomonas_salina.4
MARSGSRASQPARQQSARRRDSRTNGTSPALFLRACYGMSGTDVRSIDIRRQYRGMPGTDVGHAAARWCGGSDTTDTASLQVG